jgi:peptide/nickel transport system ATP-binding protein
VSGLCVEELTVRYGTGRHAFTAVDRVNLAVPPGTAVGLVGESGSGKSTLARALVGLVPVHSGRISLGSARLTRADRRRIQLVFQDPYSSLNPRLVIGDAIAEAVDLSRRLPTAERRTEVLRLLDLVRLDPAVAGRYPRELSGGQRQRVALARALAVRPDLLVADEVTSALDVSVQGAVLNLVRELRTTLGLSLLFISHNLAVVRYVCDVIAVMYLGRIVEVAPTDQLVAAPRHPYTRTLLAAVPRLGAPLGANGDGPADAEPADPHHPPPGCRFHTRCPVGPLVRPDRTVCLDRDPWATAADRPHRAACHFVED